MSTTAAPLHTLADLLERLGGVSPSRVRLIPAPGSATEADAAAAESKESRLCELVDGVLVEKIMGYRESILALALGALLRSFVAPRKLGLVSTSDGMVRLFPGLVRNPDVAFVSWSRIPGGRVPSEPVPHLIPDLAIEVLSEGNTLQETERKLREYFAAGVQQVWLVDPQRRSIRVHTTPESATVHGEADAIDGGDVLPGFRLRPGDIFSELDQTAG